MALRSKLKRAGWLFLALLFIVTGLGVGVWGFWEFTHQKTDSPTTTPETATLRCANDPSIPEITAGSSNLAGTKLPGYTPTNKIDGLQCIDIKVGSGAALTSSSNIVAIYTGAVAKTGVIFESSLDSGQPITISLGQVIPGWTQGLPGMKVGGQRRLLIPATLAYGANPPPSSGIPANGDLVFDITILDAK